MPAIVFSPFYSLQSNMAAKISLTCVVYMFYCLSDTEGKLRINLLYTPSYSRMKAIYMMDIGYYGIAFISNMVVNDA